jgi:hypothetical protein
MDCKVGGALGDAVENDAVLPDRDQMGKPGPKAEGRVIGPTLASVC